MAAPSFRVAIDAKKLNSFLTRTQMATARKALDAQMRIIAEDARKELVQRTPRRYTGNTKAGWQVLRKSASNYTVRNRYKAMKFIEDGTKAHGPKKAKFLFVPKTKAATLAGARAVLANPKRFKRGRDFYLAKKVRGIKGIKIVARVTRLANAKAGRRFNTYLKAIR